MLAANALVTDMVVTGNVTTERGTELVPILSISVKN